MSILKKLAILALMILFFSTLFDILYELKAIRYALTEGSTQNVNNVQPV